MSIPATDILLKSAIEAAFADLRANPWLLDDVFSGLATDPLSRAEYGYKEVKAAKDWFLKTDIPVLLQWRIPDAPQLPCIGIAYNPGRELEERANLADDLIVEQEQDTKIVKVYSNFTPTYDPNTGTCTFPQGTTTDVLATGQYLVSSRSGHAFPIIELIDISRFKIRPGVQEDFIDAFITPKSSTLNVHRELTFHSESFTIGCHTQSTPATTMWLWQVLVYSLYRYKEAYLEGRGFELSTINFSALERNQDFPVEQVYSRYVTLSGQTEINWIKYKATIFDNFTIRLIIDDGDGLPPTSDSFYGPPGNANETAWEVDTDELPMLGED